MLDFFCMDISVNLCWMSCLCIILALITQSHFPKPKYRDDLRYFNLADVVFVDFKK